MFGSGIEDLKFIKDIGTINISAIYYRKRNLYVKYLWHLSE